MANLDGTYISLEEASSLLMAQGLQGQSVRLLRNAIDAGKLGAVKDGRSWRTTKECLSAYVEAIQVQPAARYSRQPNQDDAQPAPAAPRKSTGGTVGMSDHWASVTVKTMRERLRNSSPQKVIFPIDNKGNTVEMNMDDFKRGARPPRFKR